MNLMNGVAIVGMDVIVLWWNQRGYVSRPGVQVTSFFLSSRFGGPGHWNPVVEVWRYPPDIVLLS